MDIIIVAVIGGGVGDNRFQGRRVVHRCLNRVKAAIGGAKHTDIAITPGLPTQPVNHRAGIGLFLG